MPVLLPRLPGPAAEALLDQRLANGFATPYEFDPRNLPEAIRFGATGGARVDEDTLAHLRNELVLVAASNGYPSTRDRVALAGFDVVAAIMLAEQEVLRSGEALRDDVWAFVGVTLAPDIVHWRFGDSRERYLGGVRNTFQRLWLRSRALDRGTDHPERWRLLEELTEDAHVQITERPSLGGDSRVATAIGEAWLCAANHHGKNAMEPIMRRAALRTRVWNETRSLADLPSDELARVLAGAFDIPVETSPEPAEAAAAVSGPVRDEINLHVGGHHAAQAQGLDVPERAPTVTSAAASEAATRVLEEAAGRRLLSRNSKRALHAVREGSRSLTRRERNALNHLLRQMASVEELRDVISELSRSVSSIRAPLNEPEADSSSSTRRRRPAIFRAR